MIPETLKIKEETMEEDKMHELIGRQQCALEAMHQEYTRLLSLLANVCSGSIDPSRVTVSMETKSWSLETQEDTPDEQPE